MNISVEVQELIKKYGDIAAVNRLSFQIEKGEIFGLLGPNGAGKTTTVEMIEGLRKPDGGSIKVCDFDVPRQKEKVKEIIGAQLQTTTLYSRIRVGESIELFAGYYRKSLPPNELLDAVSLNDKKNSYVETLSGGQKQRLALALAMINDPQVLFLDEPTTGLDPQARRNIWGIIEELKKQGKTVLLTTHYMEEAEKLCDRVSIIDHGKIIALDTPDELIQKQNIDSAIEFTCNSEIDMESIRKIQGINKVSRDGEKYILHSKQTSALLSELMRKAEENGFTLENISTRKATLEDVFLKLTGRKLRD
jgi:ABC-2 type transport system ATP-binding protein